jgi:hypothetical protein
MGLRRGWCADPYGVSKIVCHDLTP